MAESLIPEGFEIESSPQVSSDIPEGFEIDTDYNRNARIDSENSRLPQWMRDEQKAKESSPTFRTGNSLVKDIIRGVPIARNFISNTEDDQQFAKEHPVASTAANIVGTGAAAIPLAMAAGTAAGPMVGGTGLANNIMTAGTTFGGLNIADYIASGGRDPDEAIHQGVTGFAQGAAGPVVSKAISPKMLHTPEQLPLPKPTNITTEPIDAKTLAHLKASMSPEDFLKVTQRGKEGYTSPAQTREMLERSLNNSKMASHADKQAAKNAEHEAMIEAVKGSVPNWVNNINSHAIGGMVGHTVGGLPGAVAGWVAGPMVKKGIEKGVGAWWGNQMMSPANQAFITAITGGAGS